jgi:hypothetical protein
MTTPLRTILFCYICHAPVAIEESKTDEHGHAIHEDCYALRVRLALVSKPDRDSSTQS